MFENGALPSRELQHAIGYPHIAANGIEDDIAGRQCGSESAARSPQQRLHAGDNFGRRKRLH